MFAAADYGRIKREHQCGRVGHDAYASKDCSPNYRQNEFEAVEGDGVFFTKEHSKGADAGSAVGVAITRVVGMQNGDGDGGECRYSPKCIDIQSPIKGGVENVDCISRSDGGDNTIFKKNA